MQYSIRHIPAYLCLKATGQCQILLFLYHQPPVFPTYNVLLVHRHKKILNVSLNHVSFLYTLCHHHIFLSVTYPTSYFTLTVHPPHQFFCVTIHTVNVNNNALLLRLITLSQFYCFMSSCHIQYCSRCNTYILTFYCFCSIRKFNSI